MIDTKALRQKILDLAIRGKLVPQDPNDEPASVLLERICTEKQQMVKDGKLKAKDIKNDTIIYKGDDNLHYEKFADGSVKCIEDEIPFELPSGWSWVRFGTLTINRDSERKPVALSSRKNVEKKYDYYGASGKIDKIDKYLFDEKLLLIGEDGANLVTRSKPIAFFAEGQYWVNNHAHCIDATDKRYLNYLCYFINAINLEPYVTGSAQPKMNQENMNNILISLPPFKEQLQILNQIDLFYEAISSLENEQQGLVDLIGMTKSKILDFAIRGKLVPQDPDDEPASVLLERIRAQKEELIKQGKIKRDKKESVIFKGEDNSYYENLPANWSITTLGTISALITKGTTPRGGNVAYLDSGIGFLRAENISGYDKLNLQNLKCIDDDTHNNYLKRSILQGDDILITIAGTLGRTAVVTEDALPLNANQAIAIVRLVSNRLVCNRYVTYALNSSDIQKSLLRQEVAMAIPNLSLENISNCSIPIPPIKEQYAIVALIDNMFATIDNIEESLK